MEKPPRIPSPPGSTFREFRIRVVPFLTFAAVLAVTIVVWRHYVGPGTLVGEVQAWRSTVVSPIPARVSVLKVRLLESVRAGQSVAEIIPTDAAGRDSLSKPTSLVSPIDGFVSFIGHGTGESVMSGDTIVVVSSPKAERIVAYQRQPLRVALRPGMPVEVRARSMDRAVGRGRIMGVGSQMEPILPELLPSKPSASASAVEYGQLVVVDIPPGLRVLPGEIVDLQPLSDPH
jgi:multidrug resistance efflux pump